MPGNTYGIVFGALKRRGTHHPEAMVERSSLAYELGMLLSLIVILPLFLYSCHFVSAVFYTIDKKKSKVSLAWSLYDILQQVVFQTKKHTYE